jgi:hypothetical protein
MNNDRDMLWDRDPKAAEGGHTHRTGSLRRFVAVFEGCHLNPKDCHRYPKAAKKMCVAAFGAFFPSYHRLGTHDGKTSGWTTGGPTSQ